MKLLIGLSGFVITMIGVILSYRLDFTVGLLITFFGVFMFWAMLPSTDQNERLRRYDR
jgi:preprotein translocase subunit SecD